MAKLSPVCQTMRASPKINKIMDKLSKVLLLIYPNKRKKITPDRESI